MAAVTRPVELCTPTSPAPSSKAAILGASLTPRAKHMDAPCERVWIGRQRRQCRVGVR